MPQAVLQREPQCLFIYPDPVPPCLRDAPGVLNPWHFGAALLVMAGQVPRTLENSRVEKQREAGSEWGGGAVNSLETSRPYVHWLLREQSWPRDMGYGSQDPETPSQE